MAAVASTPTPVPIASAPAEASTKPAAASKPARPDEEAFRKAEAAARREHEDAQKALSEIKKKLDFAKPGGRNPRQQELKNELAEIRSQVASKKSARGKIEDSIKALQDSINVRVKELNTKKGSMPYRSVEDLEAAVQALDRKVSTGQMKIVEEKKALQEISNLNKQKKNFNVFDEQQKAIDVDRAKLKAMKDQKQDPELKQLNERYDELDNEFKEIKSEQDSAYQNINSLRDERTRLQALQQDKWAAMKQLQDEYYQNRNAFRAYEKEARKIRDERRAKEQAEYVLEKKRAAAAERMEAASHPAFTSEINTCETLIAYFDPSSAEAAKKAKLTTAPRELAAVATREVTPLDENPLKGKKFVKVEEEYFTGTGGKKKKGKKNRAAAATSTEGSEPVASTSGRLSVNASLLEQLVMVDVPAPISHDDVPQVLENLRKKLQHYKDNQEKVTKENIAKAQKEIEKLEQEGESPILVEAEAEAVASEEEEEKKGEETVIAAAVAEES